MTVIHREWRTCVAVYAIEREVTWPFRPSVLATSCHREVTSTTFSLDADEGEVNMWRYAWKILDCQQYGMEMDTMDLHAKEVGLLESPPQAFRDHHPLPHIDTTEKSLMQCCTRIWHYESWGIFFNDEIVRSNQKRKVRNVLRIIPIKINRAEESACSVIRDSTFLLASCR